MNECKGSIAGRYERPLMGTSGLLHCSTKFAFRRQTAHSLKPSLGSLPWRSATERERWATADLRTMRSWLSCSMHH